MTVPFFDLKTGHDELKPRLLESMSRVVEGSHFILGPETEAFEAEFAKFCGATHALGVGNGLDALKIILMALGIGHGDEVIVPAHTFIATWLAVSDVGATPVPVDIDPETYTMDPARVEDAVTSRTRALLPVHLYGRLADMAALREIARRHDLRIIEDAAQAHGAADRASHRAGALADAAAFSFYPSKNLGALGDGGAIVTNDEALATRCRLLRSYGSTRKYHHEVKGLNSRLDEIQSAFLRLKLPHLADKNSERDRLAVRYIEALRGIESLILPQRPQGEIHAWHLFVVRSACRKGLMDFLATRGVSTLIHYPVPCHLQHAYAATEYKTGAFPATEQAASQVVSLPLWPEMSEAQQDEVIDRLHEWQRLQTAAA